MRDCFSPSSRWKIAYSQCWEDPDTIREALCITRDDDVLAVTSGGCNVLALLLDRPRSITAVDINPAQNHLLELKLAAILGLDHSDLLNFLGVMESGHRLAVYRHLRAHLSDGAQEYWGLHQEEIEAGVIHSGRFERYLRMFRRLVLPLIHHKERVQEALRPKSLEEQKSFYDHVWDTFRWRTLFHLFFGRWLMSRIGRYPGAFQHADLPSIAGHYMQRTRHALREIPVASNYFLQYMATGEYKTALPPYLSPENLGTLKSHANRVRIVTADLLDFLATTPAGTFSKFYLSDVFEFCSMEQYENALRQIVRVARPGARLCYYNNLVPRSHPGSLAPVIQSEDALADRLHCKDRSFVYRRVVVEQVSK